jgi:uncharacterized membrane protein YidH (DUF202 family)
MEDAMLAELYKTAVEEYRFQVQLNWSRSQYLLAFGVAILASGAGLLKLDGGGAEVMIAAVFAVGVLAAGMSIALTVVQHDYYRSARDRAKRFEEALQVPADLRMDTTPTMTRAVATTRLGKVVNLLYVLFAFIGALDVVGFVYTLAR